MHNSTEWSNKTLEDYLEALQRWTEDMDGYYENNNIPLPPVIEWCVFANIPAAASIYE